MVLHEVWSGRRTWRTRRTRTSSGCLGGVESDEVDGDVIRSWELYVAPVLAWCSRKARASHIHQQYSQLNFSFSQCAPYGA